MSETQDINQASQQTTIESDTNIESLSDPTNVVQSDTTHSIHSTRLGPTRVPGTYPPEWLPDNETTTCMSCDGPFTLLKRRHHCRSCGKIFCSECCRHKAKLLYLDNKEARVCKNCQSLIEHTLLGPDVRTNIYGSEQEPVPSGSDTRSCTEARVQGVLKSVSQTRSNNNECNTSSSSAASSTEQQHNKQVIFADGIRPGTDLTEPFPYPLPSPASSGGPSSLSYSLLTRQNRAHDGQSSSKEDRSSKSLDVQHKNITVCDEIGYLPPIVISKNSPLMSEHDSQNSPGSLTSYIISQFRVTNPRRTIQSSMESRSCPLNGILRFEDISNSVGVDGVVTFLLLKDYYLKVKTADKKCCMSRGEQQQRTNSGIEEDSINIDGSNIDDTSDYWCFISDGLYRFGQAEIMLVIDKGRDQPCIPRDVFKIYLTLHELALRRQSLDNLGNLLFQDGLFGSRDTAGLLFAKPLPDHCLKNLIVPTKDFLVALVLQRWEVPWSKVFPIRLLLRLGHKFGLYPYPLVSLRIREPVYYEVGHTIISILGDFRNFRYGINHVDGLRVMLDKVAKRVLVQLNRSSYQQFNKVLDSSNNEHVLAWSSSPIPGSYGHLVSVQNEDGNYDTVEFFKDPTESSKSFGSSGSEHKLGASFIIFSGALKIDQSGQSAKISVVEDGLLIQIQSCTMSALKNAIHFMHHFDIDCESEKDLFNRVEIEWLEDT